MGPMIVTPEEFDRDILDIGKKLYGQSRTIYNEETGDYEKEYKAIQYQGLRSVYGHLNCRCRTCGVYGVKRTWYKFFDGDGFVWICPNEKCGKATVEDWE